MSLFSWIMILQWRREKLTSLEEVSRYTGVTLDQDLKSSIFDRMVNQCPLCYMFSLDEDFSVNHFQVMLASSLWIIIIIITIQSINTILEIIQRNTNIRKA